MDDMRVAAYLERIGARRPEQADLDGLRVLQRAHLRTVPFENLSIHLGEHIVLTRAELLAKLIDRRRGGFCYELNGAFAALLTALGYRVSLHSARVFGDDNLGPPMDHLALRVDLSEPWLVDVGFGAFSLGPLRLDSLDEQLDPAGTFQIVPTKDGQLDVTMDGAPRYRLDRRQYALADFVPTCWWQQTSPDSHFTQSLTCSRVTADGRVTLSGDRLISTVNGEREESTLASDAEIRTAYSKHFGIELERVPRVRTSPPALG